MSLRTIIVTAAFVLMGVAASTYAPAQVAPKAASPHLGNTLRFLGGFPGRPEDLVQVPGTDWIIASSFAGLKTPKTFNGRLVLIDATTRIYSKVAINQADVARAPYAACPAPPDPARFSAHGLNIRREANGHSTLFVVGHLGREAIEVFDVAINSGKPVLTWIGCVPAIDGAFYNSVVGLPDGRILTTDFLHAGATMADLFASKKTGAVYIWKPGRAWAKLPGTDLSGPNGIEVAAEQGYLFVADSGTPTVFRYDINATDKAPYAIKPGFRTDNIRWASEGRLLFAGTKPDPKCQPPGLKCPVTLFVKAFDPNTGNFTTLFDAPATPSFPNLSSALLVNGILWLGSPEENRVAYMELPRDKTSRR